MRRRAILVVATVFLLTATATYGQRITGSIDGVVTDPTAAVLPGVEVTVTSEATGQVRTTLTNENGLYNVPLLPSGRYSVEASLPGFRTEIRRGILIEVDRNARVNIQLDVGEVTETIEVTADAPLIEADTSSLGQVIDSRRVAELPLNGREFIQLATLTPGVQPNAEGTNLSTQNLSVNVNGSREEFNNFLLDGMDNNDSGNAQIVIVPSIDSIQEFKVQTSNYSAEYGRSAGGLVNVTTKSGTNAFHGSAYEFLRNSAMDARNFFADPDGPKPGFKRNQFGATLGGPISRNKTFFFGSYERTVIRQAQSATARVPPEAWRRGDFSSLGMPIIDPLTGQPFPGNVIPSDRFHSIGKTFVDTFPSPNASGVNNLNSLSTLTVDQDSIAARVDHQFTESDSVFVRYAYWNQPRLEPFARSPTTINGYGVFLDTRSQGLIINHTHVFSPNLVNELRVGYVRLKGGLFPEQRGVPIARDLGLRGTRVFEEPNLREDFINTPEVVAVGFNDLRSGNPHVRFDNHYNYVNNIAYTRGVHRMKMGFEARRTHNNYHGGATASGQYVFENRYTGNSIADMLLGFPSSTVRQVGDTDDYGRTWHFSGYFQDDWRISDRLTLNMGVRYEFQTTGYNKFDRKASFQVDRGIIVLAGDGPIPDDILPILEQFPGRAIKDGSLPRSGFRNDYNNFAPRLGFAYNVGGRGSTVVRGGIGVFYVEVPQNKTHGAKRGFPFILRNQALGSADPRNPNLTLDDPFPAALISTGIDSRAVDIDMRTGYMSQVNLNVQQELGNSVVVEVGYVGSIGKKLHRNRNVNQAVPGSGSVSSRRPFPLFGNTSQLEASASSRYHSFQTRIDRRLVQGFSVLGSYTWSKSLDDDSGSTGVGGGTSQNAYDLRDDWGPSIFDRTHRGSIGFLWQMPFGDGLTGLASAIARGWQINGIYTASSGQPFTPNLQGNHSQTGQFQDRPHLIGQWKLDNPDPARWFNTAAFVRPPPGEFGNAGRNHLRGPGVNNFDFAVFKNFSYREIPEFVQFRAEVFNLANHPQFLLPNRIFDSSQFGTISRARDNRQIQLSLRISF